MTELVRLMDDNNASQLQRMLIKSMAEERCRTGARERVLLAMGLPITAPLASTTAPSKAVAMSPAGKALAVFVLLTAGSVSALVYANYPEPKVCPPTGQAPAAPPPRTVSVQSPEPSVTPKSTPAPFVPQPNTTRAGLVRRPPVGSSEDSLREELALMDRARLSLAQGDPTDTISAVRRYETRYPSGAFTHEAAFLRVSALHAQRDGSASVAARSFLTQYPASPYAGRVRAFIDRDTVQVE